MHCGISLSHSPLLSHINSRAPAKTKPGLQENKQATDLDGTGSILPSKMPNITWHIS